MLLPSGQAGPRNLLNLNPRAQVNQQQVTSAKGQSCNRPKLQPSTTISCGRFRTRGDALTCKKHRTGDRWGVPLILNQQQPDGGGVEVWRRRRRPCFALLFLRRSNLASRLDCQLATTRPDPGEARMRAKEVSGIRKTGESKPALNIDLNFRKTSEA